MNAQDQVQSPPASPGYPHHRYPRRSDYVNFAYPRPETPQLIKDAQTQAKANQAKTCLSREDRDRSSIESDGSVPGMTDDHGSVASIDEEQPQTHALRPADDHIWDSFWATNGRKASAGSQRWDYPALVAPTFHLGLHDVDLGCAIPSTELNEEEIKPLPLRKKSSWARTHKFPRRVQTEEDDQASTNPFPQDSAITPRKPVQRPVRPSYTTSHTAEAATPKASGFRELFALRGSKSTRDLRSGSASSAFSACSGFSESTASIKTTITTPSCSPLPSPTLVPAVPFNTTLPIEPVPPVVAEPLLRPEPLRIVKQPSLPDLRRKASRYYRPAAARNVTSPTVSQSQSPNPRPLPPVPFRHALPPGLPEVLPNRQPPPRPLRSPPRAQPVQPISYQAQFYQEPSPMVSVFEWDSDGESEADDEPTSFAKRIGRAFTRHRRDGEHGKREVSRHNSPGEHQRQTSAQSHHSDFSFTRDRSSELASGLVKVTSGESWKPEPNRTGQYEGVKHADKERVVNDSKPVLKRQGSAFLGKILSRHRDH